MKKSYQWLSLYVISLLFFLVPVYADEHLPYTILAQTINHSERDDRQYQVIQLNNNMKVLLIADDKATQSLASLALPVGSLHDPKSQQGLAHYTEHMVLMGSKKYPAAADFSQYLSQHAGSYNASTASYRTAFYFEVENSAFAPALDRLADAIAAPLLDAKYADKERNAVDAELTMARSNDGFRIGQVDAETANQAHPTVMFSGGNLTTLSDKADSNLQTELEAFYQRYYSANIMVGVIYSNLPLEQLATLAVDSFGRIKDNHIVVDPITQTALPPDTLGKWIYMEPAQAKKVLYIQFPIENNLSQFSSKSDEYIGYMLSNRSPNTLFDKLQKQGLIESINAGNDPIRYGNSGILSIFVSLTDAGLANKDKVIADIFSYLQLIKQQGVSQQYYDEIAKVLAQEFKYPDITRDMSYVEWLSDQMLFYPTEHILDADYVADHFDQAAIKNRLQQLTPENARIWLIAPNQNTDKVAYFVNAPYRVEDITPQQIKMLTANNDSSQFELPLLNPYIADDFTIIEQRGEGGNAESVFSQHGNQYHFSSEFFADEPKAAIVLSLRNNFALNNAKNQVMFNLLDYLASRELAELNFQASVAGISLSTSRDNGLMLSASGFSQHLTDMIITALASYHSMDINQHNMALAKSWYLEKLEAADHANSYSLAMQPVNALSTIPYSERSVKRQIIADITVDDLIEYRYQLLFNSVPYMISLGNLSNEQSTNLYNQIKQTLNPKTVYQLEPNLVIKRKIDALISQRTASTDSALLMGFVPQSDDKITSRVTSYLLYKMISPWFYDQLRSNEQLGYAVFSLPVYIGESSGIGFLIQSNQYDPIYLNERYQAFYPVILAKLNGMTDDEFVQYQQAVLNELLMPPQTLDEEFSPYLADYRQSLFDFSSKQQKIAKLKSLNKSDVIDFYRQAVMTQNGLVIASEVLGNQPDKAIMPLDGLNPYQGAAQLQQQLLKE